MMNRISILPMMIFCCLLQADAQPVAPSSPETNVAARIVSNERKDDAVVSPEAQKIPENSAAEKNTLESSPFVMRRIGVDVSASVALTIEDAVRMTLENNNDIRAAETDVRAAEFDLRAARGAFDPVFENQSFYERSATPVVSALEGGANGRLTRSGFSSNFNFRGNAPRFGGSYQFEFNNSRAASNSPFNSINPQFGSSFSLSFTQPLVRGLRTDENRRRISVAKKNISLTDAQFRQKTIETIEQTEAAYWDLTFGLKNLQVQKEAVAAADAQLQSNRRQVEQGVLAPADIVQAETQIAVFKQNLYAAEEQVAQTENNLKKLILPDLSSDLWTRAIIPVSPVNLDAPRVEFTEALRAALDSRPEIAALETTKEINQINRRFLKDQTRPRFDLIAEYRAEGLAGKLTNPDALNPIFGGDADLRERVGELSALAKLPPLPPVPPVQNSIPPNLVGGYGQSLSNLFGQNYPTFRLGIRVEIPIGNRAAKAELGRALVGETKLEYERKQAEQIIAAEVRNAVQAVESSEKRRVAATEAREAAAKQYEAERRQLAAGTSTVFLVLERQTGFVAAQGREIEAQIAVNKAAANLRRVVGGTLNRANVAVQPEK